MELCTDVERLIAAFMIGNLDHRGYLDMTYEEILDFDDFSKLHLDLDDIESATLVLRGWNQSVVGPEISENVCCFKFRVHILKIHFFQTLWNIYQNWRSKIQTRIAEKLDMDIEDVEEYHKMICQMNPMWVVVHIGRSIQSNCQSGCERSLKLREVADRK